MLDQSPWKCAACKHDVSWGSVLVFNTNAALGAVGSYPKKASPDSPPDYESDAARIARDPSVASHNEQMQQWINEAAWMVFDRPVNIGFAAYCSDCVPATHDSAYTILAPRSAAVWMAWIVHLQSKTWMGAWDMSRMVDYWFANRGLEPGAYL